jgi:hypothetical protein
MRIHGIHLRGLSAPPGDHPLGLDPAYTIVRLPDAASARGFVELIQALLYPASEQLLERDTRGRAVLSLALRSDSYVIAADFARRRMSLGRHEASGGRFQSLSSDPREIEEYALAVGFPQAPEFRLFQTCGMGAGTGDELLPMRRSESLPAPATLPQSVVAPKPVVEPPHAVEQQAVNRPAKPAVDAAARAHAEHAATSARLLAEHEQRSLALAHDRARAEAALEQALAAARRGRVRDDVRRQELRGLAAESSAVEREYEATLAELEKSAALADATDDLDARIAHFRTLVTARETDRRAIDETRAEVLAERSRLRGVPRRQLLPIGLGIALGVAGGIAGAIGQPLGYGLAALGVIALLAALGMARAARSELQRSEALLAALRVRERTSERRFETEGSQVRNLMISLGLDSLDALSSTASRHHELSARAAELKARMTELATLFPSTARTELAHLEAEREQGSAVAAVRAARDALLALPAEIPMPSLPPAPPAPPAVTASEVEEEETPVDPPSPEPPPPAPPAAESAPAGPNPNALLDAAVRVIGRPEIDVRARMAPALPVYLRALTGGSFTNARRSDDGQWLLRGAARDEQPFERLPPRERALVCLALQLALLESLAAERRVPLLVGPDLPIGPDAETGRALARAFKRLSAVVQVVQACVDDKLFAEHAGKCLAL